MYLESRIPEAPSALSNASVTAGENRQGFELGPQATSAPATIASSGSSGVERSNVVTLPDPTRMSVFVGKAAPMGFTLPGASGPPSVYVFGNIDTLTPGSSTAGNPGLFIGIPLSENGVTATSIASALSTTIGGGATTDFLAGQLLRQYRQVQETLASDRFRSVLPPGVRVIPSIVMTIPSHEVAGLLTGGGIEAAPNASFGIGMTMVAGAERPGGRAGDGVAIFANTRILVNEALEAARRGEDLPTSRNFNFGVIALNVPVPRTGQTANVGLGTGIRTDNFDPNAPWRVRLGDGSEVDMPAPLALIMNGLTGANSPINLQQADLSEFATRLGLSPETLAAAAETGETAFSIASWGLDAAGVVAAAKVNPLLGILAGVGLANRAITAFGNWSNEQTAEAMIARGMHDPSVALEGLLPEADATDMITYFGHVLGLTVDHAILSGRADGDALLRSWSRAAAQPWSPDDRVGAQRVMLANLVIGEFERADEIATALGDPIPYTQDGLDVALRGVGSTQLMQLRLAERAARADAVVDATGPDGEWRKIRVTAREDENGETYFVAVKHSDNSQHYELPENVRGDRQASIEYVRRALAAGEMNDSFVADPPRRVVSEILQTPLENGEVNRARLDALFDSWLERNPNSRLTVIGSFMVDRYNDPSASEAERLNVGYLYNRRPEMAPAAILNRTIFRSGENFIRIPEDAVGSDRLLQPEEVASAFRQQRERLGEAEYGSRVRATAEALHAAGWPLNFGVPELAAALGQVERERGAPTLSPAFRENQHRYRP